MSGFAIGVIIYRDQFDCVKEARRISEYNNRSRLKINMLFGGNAGECNDSMCGCVCHGLYFQLTNSLPENTAEEIFERYSHNPSGPGLYSMEERMQYLQELFLFIFSSGTVDRILFSYNWDCVPLQPEMFQPCPCNQLAERLMSSCEEYQPMGNIYLAVEK